TDVIEYQEGDAEALPFPDAYFSITTSTTVMERVDADRMLEEMIRVTKPGGKVAVLVQATDRSRLVNLPLGAELKAKVETNRGLPGRDRGCADASLYRRFHQAGLVQVKMLPQLATFDREHAWSLQDTLLANLTREEGQEWRTAVAEGEAEGTFFIAEPYHCAVGTKP
ncbi:MAG: methyltransferase domain-containing protein, partial [Dehalococcoidia bacterium]